MKPQAIHLHIEELVLHGVADGLDRERVGDALQRELTRLIAERGLPPTLSGGDALRLEVGPVRVEPGTRPEVLGALVAQSFFQGDGR